MFPSVITRHVQRRKSYGDLYLLNLVQACSVNVLVEIGKR